MNVNFFNTASRLAESLRNHMSLSLADERIDEETGYIVVEAHAALAEFHTKMTEHVAVQKELKSLSDGIVAALKDKWTVRYNDEGELIVDGFCTSTLVNKGDNLHKFFRDYLEASKKLEAVKKE